MYDINTENCKQSILSLYIMHKIMGSENRLKMKCSKEHKLTPNVNEPPVGKG